MKKIFKISITLTFIVCFVNNTFTAENSANKITILHTNDVHGNFQPIIIKAKSPGEQDKKLGGILALDSYVSQIRNQSENVLLFDAGDFMTGNPICDIEYRGAIGGAMINFFNELKYDGLTLGNHEFDISVGNVRNLIKLAEFPIFSANLFTLEKNLFTHQPYHIFQKNELCIGVIGVIVDDLPDYLNAPQRDELLLKPATEVIDSLAKVIDAETDLIVVLSHSGVGHDKKIAEEIGSEVDIIIGGHSHTRIKKVIHQNGKLIVQAGDKWANLGRLDVTVRNDKVSDFEYKLIPLWNEGIKPNPGLVKIVDYYESKIDKEYGRVIGELINPWKRSSAGESNIGNFITDCIREFSNTDFSVINSGGIRSNLAAGRIKKLDIKNILPFANSITKFQVTGKELFDLIQTNAEATAFRKYGILQVSGMKYEWQKNGEEIQIVKALINGKEIDNAKFYTGASVDFVVTNAQKYFGFLPKQKNNLMMPLAEVVMKKIEQQESINVKVEGRMLKR
jgi:5'-nucleotidase / UDP-sugar diphosphatase